MIIKYHTSWLLDKPTRDGAGLRLRVRWNKSKYITTVNIGISVNADKWLPNVQRCIPNSFHTKIKVPASVINNHIDKIEERIRELFAVYSEQEHLPTIQELRERLKVIVGVSECKRSIFQDYDRFMTERQVNMSITDGTIYGYQSLKKILLQADANITYDDLTEERITEIMQARFKFGNRNSYLNISVTRLKTFLRWASRKGLYKGDLHNTMTLRFKEVKHKQEIVYLTQEELKSLREFKTDNRCQRDAVDMFLFCCYTSLRFSDAIALRRENIRDNSIVLTIKKTNTQVTIELNDHSREIIERQRKKIITGDRIFRRMNSCWYNSILKNVAEKLEFNTPVLTTYLVGNKVITNTQPKWQLMTSHVARRTFVVNALSLGIPPDVVMKWTGHSKYESMKPYIDICSKAKSDFMSRFNF